MFCSLKIHISYVLDFIWISKFNFITKTVCFTWIRTKIYNTIGFKIYWVIFMHHTIQWISNKASVGSSNGAIIVCIFVEKFRLHFWFFFVIICLRSVWDFFEVNLELFMSKRKWKKIAKDELSSEQDKTINCRLYCKPKSHKLQA